MKLLPIALLACFACGSNSIASSYFVSGSALVRWIAAEDRLNHGSKNLDDLTDAWQATAFLDGIFDTLEAHSMLCSSGGVTASQLRAIASKYLNEYPERWNGSAQSLVENALRQAFPCSR